MGEESQDVQKKEFVFLCLVNHPALFLLPFFSFFFFIQFLFSSPRRVSLPLPLLSHGGSHIPAATYLPPPLISAGDKDTLSRYGRNWKRMELEIRFRWAGSIREDLTRQEWAENMEGIDGRRDEIWL